MTTGEAALAARTVRPAWRRYLALTKPRVVALMVLTVIVGMGMARPEPPPWTLVLLATTGIALMAASGAALNHLVDRRIDAVMLRTRHRPLPRGELHPAAVATFAALLAGAGAALLLAGTNLLCLALTAASLIGYAGIYSVGLKPYTEQNIVIGGAAGATPPLLGWVAVTGSVEPGALLLFLIVLVWTPPHFWALAIHRVEDYRRAGVPMLPVTRGVRYTADRVLGYAVALLLLTLLPAAIGLAGAPYAVGAALLGLGFVAHAWRLRRDVRAAMPTFRYSIAYLAALFALMLVDRLLIGTA